MKILLLGAEGQVGFELQRSLAVLGPLKLATRSGTRFGDGDCLTADLGDPDALQALIRAEAPDWIVNAAAYTAVDQAEVEPALAQRINAEALAAIGAAARATRARVLHFSSDYVFAGNATAPWRETDPTAPLGAYGRSKSAGEQALRDSGAEHLILRTAWVFAARGHNFLRTMLRLADTLDRISVVDDQIGSPTTAALIADISAHLLAQLRGAPADDPRFGTYHLTASGQTSWHGFARALLQSAVAAKLLRALPELVAIASADYPTRAARPAWSVLDTHKLQNTFALHLPHWQEGMTTVIRQLADATARDVSPD